MLGGEANKKVYCYVSYFYMYSNVINFIIYIN